MQADFNHHNHYNVTCMSSVQSSLVEGHIDIVLFAKTSCGVGWQLWTGPGSLLESAVADSQNRGGHNGRLPTVDYLMIILGPYSALG